MEESQNTPLETPDVSNSVKETPPTKPSPPPEKQVNGGVNKYFIIAGVLGLIIIGGIVYRTFFIPESAKPIVTGVERYITITTHANTWSFNPEFIELDQGDEINLTVINEDDYDHGFAIDAFGISQRMPALGMIQIKFVVTKAGDFPFYCSVSCGSGTVDGEDRGHFDQIGKMHVRSIISETINYGSTDTPEVTLDPRESAMLQEANRYAEKFGFTSDVEAVIDNDNALLNQYETEGRFESQLKSLSGIDFQAIYFKGDLVRLLPIWVLIDTTTGEVLKDVTANDGIDN